MIKLLDQKTLLLNFMITLVSLHHYVFWVSVFLFLLICFGNRSSYHRCVLLKRCYSVNFTGNTCIEVYNFLKNRHGRRSCFFCKYHKTFRSSFLYDNLWWLLLKMVEKFLRISCLKFNLRKICLQNNINWSYYKYSFSWNDTNDHL